MTLFNFASPKKPIQVTPREWISWRLKKWFTIGLLLVEIEIIVVIIVLQRISSRNQGLRSVPQVQTDPTAPLSLSNIWSYGLLWTFLPSFLMALYQMGFNAMIAGMTQRQPYVDLNNSEQDATTAGRTIMLDYRAYSTLYNWLVAFRMNHSFIGCALFLSSVTSIALVPLASHLFAAIPIVVTSNVNVTFPNTFESAPLSNLDIQPAVTLARSVLTYGAQSPPWSTSKFAFEPFNVDQFHDQRNYTAPVTAYYGQVDCEILDVPTPDVSTTSTNDTSLSFHVLDRGCLVPSILIPVKLTIARSFGYGACDDEVHNSRIGILSGIPSSVTDFSNLTLVSCIPSYWKTAGILTISTAGGSPPKVESFTENGNDETEFRPTDVDIFETDLASYLQFDPKGLFNSDLFGTAVYEVAKKSNAQNPLDAATIKSSLESVFAAVFMYLTTTSLIQKADSRTMVAQQTRSETRLVVVSPVFWIVLALLILAAICNVNLIFYIARSRSILEEEPKGLLGAAVLLHDSDVTKFVAHVPGQLPSDIGVRKMIKAQYNVMESKCWYDAESRTIKLTGLEFGTRRRANTWIPRWNSFATGSPEQTSSHSVLAGSSVVPV
jgi:hypothetical protein